LFRWDNLWELVPSSHLLSCKTIWIITMQTNTCLKNKIKWDSSVCSKRPITHGCFELAFQNEDAIHSIAQVLTHSWINTCCVTTQNAKSKISKYQVQLIGWLEWISTQQACTCRMDHVWIGDTCSLHSCPEGNHNGQNHPHVSSTYIPQSWWVVYLPSYLDSYHLHSLTTYLWVVTYYILIKVGTR